MNAVKVGAKTNYAASRYKSGRFIMTTSYRVGWAGQMSFKTARFFVSPAIKKRQQKRTFLALLNPADSTGAISARLSRNSKFKAEVSQNGKNQQALES
jgi:hypothetical protein